MNNAIFTIFDDNYQKYVRASLNSLRANYPDHPTILVCYDGCDPSFIEYLEDFEDLKIIPFIKDLPIFKDLDIKDDIELKYFYRFLLWTDYFDGYDKILNLDMDTLILGSLKDLFEYEDLFIVSDHPILPDIRIFDIKSKNDPDLKNKLNQDEILFPDNMDDMANGGVYLLPKKYRNKETLNELLRIKNKYDKYISFNEQSIISLFCLINDIEYSDSFEYNFMLPFYYIDFTGKLKIRYPGYSIPDFGNDSTEFLKDIKILHFPGERKPDTDLFIQFEQNGGFRYKIQDLFYHYMNIK